MLTSLTNPSAIPTVKKFPGLYKSKQGEKIIFCDERNKADSRILSGIVVLGDQYSRLGHYSTEWIADCFEPYYGDVILKQDNN